MESFYIVFSNSLAYHSNTNQNELMLKNNHLAKIVSGD